MMKTNDMSRWLKDNWLSLVVGLVLPAILAALWKLVLQALGRFAPDTLARLSVVCIIACFMLSGALIHFILRYRRMRAFVNETFYPHETIHATYHSVDEEMPIDAEFTRGWNEAMEENDQ